MKKYAKWEVGQKAKLEGYASFNGQIGYFDLGDGLFKITQDCKGQSIIELKNSDGLIFSIHRRNVTLIKIKKKKNDGRIFMKQGAGIKHMVPTQVNLKPLIID